MTLNSFSVGTNDRGQIVVSNSGDGDTVVTGLSPEMARTYAAMMMAFADLLDPPAPEQNEEAA